MERPLLSASIQIFCLRLDTCTAEVFLEFCVNHQPCSLCTDHYRCRDPLRKVTGTELLSETWSSDQGGSFCGGAWQKASSTPCTCTPSSLMRPTWKCCLPGLWVSLRLYEFLMFGVNYSTVLSSTHKDSISVATTGLLFDPPDILYLLLSFLPIIEKYPFSATGGLALALVQFFYVKYLVLFGLPSMLATLDKVLPPKLPRCVSITHGFTEMWR